MTQFTKLAVIGFTAFAFSACDGNTSGDGAEEALLTALESGGYVVNVSSELLSEDDNFDIYMCNDGEEGTYYILDEFGEIDYDGSTYVYEDGETMNIWEMWPNGFNDVEIITAGTVNPGSLVEGETYDLEEWDTDDVVGSLTVNVIETFDCTTLEMPNGLPK